MPRPSRKPLEWSKSADDAGQDRNRQFARLLREGAEQSARRRGSRAVDDSDIEAAWRSIAVGVRPPGWMVVTADAGFVAAGAMTSAAVALAFLEGGGPQVAAALLLLGAVLVGVIAGAMKYGPRE